eukprot:COSAG01_NODE_4841_length_4692_cov_66.837361_2_plen_241_part_00
MGPGKYENVGKSQPVLMMIVGAYLPACVGLGGAAAADPFAFAVNAPPQPAVHAAPSPAPAAGYSSPAFAGLGSAGGAMGGGAAQPPAAPGGTYRVSIAKSPQGFGIRLNDTPAVRASYTACAAASRRERGLLAPLLAPCPACAALRRLPAAAEPPIPARSPPGRCFRGRFQPRPGPACRGAPRLHLRERCARPPAPMPVVSWCRGVVHPDAGRRVPSPVTSRVTDSRWSSQTPHLRTASV